MNAPMSSQDKHIRLRLDIGNVTATLHLIIQAHKEIYETWEENVY